MDTKAVLPVDVEDAALCGPQITHGPTRGRRRYFCDALTASILAAASQADVSKITQHNSRLAGKIRRNLGPFVGLQNSYCGVAIRWAIEADHASPNETQRDILPLFTN